MGTYAPTPPEMGSVGWPREETSTVPHEGYSTSMRALGPLMGVRRWRGRTACAVHAYSLVGNDSCIGGGATLTAHFAKQAVHAGVGAFKLNWHQGVL